MWTFTGSVLSRREEAILHPSVNYLRVALCQRLPRLIVVGAFLILAGAVSTYAASAPQATFAAPDQAVSALVAAAEAESMADLLKILGPEGKTLVSSGDAVADRQALEDFVALYAEANRITVQGADRATLVLGKDEWPFPIPIVSEGGGWRFDTAAGKEEI